MSWFIIIYMSVRTSMWELKSTQLIPGSLDQTSESQNSLKCESHLSKSCESTVITNLNHICLTNLNLPNDFYFLIPTQGSHKIMVCLRGAQTLQCIVRGCFLIDIVSTNQFTLHRYLLNTNNFLKTAFWEISASCLGQS